MIVWINGTFGVGKTTTVAHLLPLLPSARVFDPEQVGFMLAANLGDHPVADFQDWPPWRRLVVATAVQLAAYTDQDLICPQTVLTPAYLREIHAGLAAAGHHVHHVLLDVETAALRHRIKASDEAVAWRLEHIEPYARAQAWLRDDADLIIDTTTTPPAAVAAAIARDLAAHGHLGEHGPQPA